MQEYVIDMLTDYRDIALLLSIGINILISILGVVPSVFLTAANLAVFGFWEGMAVSFAGEAAGAVISFVLYRKGFRRLTDLKGFSHPKVKRLLSARGSEAFLLILSLRLLPFVPSGIVTFMAAIGKTSWKIFAAASSLGKVPAILIEGYSVYQLIHWTWEGKVISSLAAVLFLVWALKKLKAQTKT
ncbi:TVP38/TMEM64 family protein [Peribacillus sp. SCS-26]|uniref:TVP38/TMEM64 family protein n=1 Tax=Paraperibacillus marinus TaxID=3115295 RepID=UPI003906113D